MPITDVPPYVTPRLAAWKRWTDPVLLWLALGSIPILLLEIDKARLPRGDQVFIDVVNIVVFVVFLVDYLVGLALTDDRRAYARGELLNLLIVLGSAAAIAPDLGAFGSARALRGVRPLRAVIAIGRVLATGGLAAREGRRMVRAHALRFAIGLSTLTWLTAAAGFTLAEDVGVDGRIDGYGDALWWAAATVTTVGYGDIAPVTFAGRAIGIATMVVGISTFAIVTAQIASFLVHDD